MKISKKTLLFLITVCVFILIPFLQCINSYLYSNNIIKHYYSINSALVLYLLNIPLIILYFINLKKKKFKLDIYDYLFIGLCIIGLIVEIFSINKEFSFFGTEYRREGYFSLLNYYLLFINWKYNDNKENIVKIKKVIYIIALVNSIYSIFQIYTNLDFILKYSLEDFMASGLCGNPNFLGSLIVTSISILTCEILIDKSKNIKQILFLILLFVTLINCQSTGPFLTYVIFLLFIYFYLKSKNKLILKKYIFIIFLLIIVYGLTLKLNTISSKKNNRILKCETCNITDNINNGGNGRLAIWKNTLDVVKNNFIVGVGYDNFHLAYPNEDVKNEIVLTITSNNTIIKEKKEYLIVDNAHNIYLHTLATGGIINLILFMLLCLLTFIKGLKTKNVLEMILLSGFVAYCVQAFFNISVIQVAPIFYVLIGMILSIRTS